MPFLSFLDVSLETANRFYSWGWKSSLVGAFITLVGITLLMWGTRVRDHDFEHKMSQLNKDAADSNKSTKALEKENLTLRTDLNAATGEVAKLQTVAANAQRALIELKESLKSRHLTEEQKTRLVRLLAGQPKGDISIGCIEISQEAFTFGQEIYDALSAAGWKVQGVNTLLASGYSFSGLLIAVKAQNAPSALPAGALQRALKEVGIGVPGTLDVKLSDNQIVLMVGAKP